MFLIDEYETKGEEKIKPLPNPLEGHWTAGAAAINPSLGSDYSQTLDMHTGVLTTKWSQRVGRQTLKISVDTILSVLIGQRWTFSSDAQVELTFRAHLPHNVAPVIGNSATQVFWNWPPSEARILERDELSKNVTSIGGSGARAGANDLLVSFALTPGQAASFDRTLLVDNFTGISSRDHARSGVPLTPQEKLILKDEQRLLKMSRPLAGFSQILALHKSSWHERWQTDIEIDGPVEDQQAVRSFLFYLRSAISPEGKMSISPFGLSNELYNGHVFWDSDIWVFPALAFIDPGAAKAIPQYRLDLSLAAIQNAEKWVHDGAPTATARINSNLEALNRPNGLKYPWESSVTGKETAPGPSRFEEHITGDVAFGLKQAAVLGLADPGKVARIVDLAEDHYLDLSQPGGGAQREIKGVVSPDESHTGDNDLYTNLLAQWCENGGSWDYGLGAHATYKLPRDQTSFLTYDNDALKGYKQAAAVLSIYPLQYPPAEREAKVMMERFADKTSKVGPAMSDSLHALIWARLGKTDKAYSLWERSWGDFVTEPHLQFAEKRNKKNTYFTTGAAGCLQTVIYGFLGFRIDSTKQDGAVWSTPLALGRILSVKPNLPAAWKSVKFKNFTVMGRRYTLTATHDGVHVTQGDK